MRDMLAKSAVILSTGLLLAGCSTTHQKSTAGPVYSESSGAENSEWQPGRANMQSEGQYSSSSSSSSTQSSGAAQSAQAGQNQWVIPLHQEQVSVSKQSADTGQIKIRKIVTTQTVNQPVQLRKESVTIEREPAGSQSSSTASTAPASSGTAFQEQTITIPLREEQPVIQKSTVVSGQVVATKNSSTQQQNVENQVRHEDVQLDRSGSAANVTIRGHFPNIGSSDQQINESSGAEKTRSGSTNAPSSKPSSGSDSNQD